MYTLHGRKYRGSQTESELERLFPTEGARNAGFTELILQALQRGYQVDFQSKKGQLRIQFQAGKAAGWVWTAFGGPTENPGARTAEPPQGACGSGVPAHRPRPSEPQAPTRPQRGAGMQSRPEAAPSTLEDAMSTAQELPTVPVGRLDPQYAYQTALCPDHGRQYFNKRGGCPRCAVTPTVRQRQAPPERKPPVVQVEPVVLGLKFSPAVCSVHGEVTLNKLGACRPCYEAQTQAAWAAYHASRQQPTPAAAPDVTGEGIEVVAKQPAPALPAPAAHTNFRPFDNGEPLHVTEPPVEVPPTLTFTPVEPHDLDSEVRTEGFDLSEAAHVAPEAEPVDPFVPEAETAASPAADAPAAPEEPVVQIETEARPAKRGRRAQR